MKFTYFPFIAIVVLLASCKVSKNQPLKFQPQEDLFIAKQYPDFAPDLKAMERAAEEARRASEHGLRTNGIWKNEGPSNIGARITTMAIHPSNENIIFAGFADGGLWRTTNGGADWIPVFDNEITLSIGSICFDPTNPSTVYVGTGDPDISGYPRLGAGLYKSTDMGMHWTYIGLRETYIISKVIVSPANPKTIFVSAMGTPFYKSADKGVYKTTDGGKNWSKVLFVNDSTGISNIVMHPQNDNILYATGWNRIRNNKRSIVAGPDARIWRSKDGGKQWEILSQGLPEDSHSRIGLAIAPSNPNVLYASYVDKADLEFSGLYRTSNGGDNWELHTALGENELQGSPMGGFGWYFGKLGVNPNDENDIFLLGVGLYRYNHPLKAWEYADQSFTDVRVHADKHDIDFRGNNLYLATDGGLYSSKLDDITQWQDKENIPTTQFYRTAYDPHRPNQYWGGAQDNGTSTGSGEDINNWERFYGGDGFQMAFHPTDDKIVYAESQRGNIVVSNDYGESWKGATTGLTGSRHWDMQYIISQHNPDVLYTGTNQIFKSITGTDVKWSPISPILIDPNSNAIIRQMTALSESPLDAKILFCGTSDGQVWTTVDGGEKWININNNLPLRYISSIKASHSNKNLVYVTLTGYKDSENTPHIYKSTNGGLQWTSIAGNLPTYAINDVFIYPNGQDNVLFVATDGGIYITKNAGLEWERLGNNMPLIQVFDMDYDYNNNALIAATFARGIQTFDLDQIDVQLETNTDQAIETMPSIYPTVTEQFVYIKDRKSMGDVEVYNMNGVLMFKSSGHRIDLQSLQSGMYIIKSGDIEKKIVKL